MSESDFIPVFWPLHFHPKGTFLNCNSSLSFSKTTFKTCLSKVVITGGLILQGAEWESETDRPVPYSKP